jgi:hypothetical protein
MCNELNRYFIELLPTGEAPVSRFRETELRREMAAHFLEKVGEWLKNHELNDKVAAMAITALGQVQITCEPDIIHQIRGQDDLNIAAIRQGSMYVENTSRWNEAQ